MTDRIKIPQEQIISLKQMRPSTRIKKVAKTNDIIVNRINFEHASIKKH